MLPLSQHLIFVYLNCGIITYYHESYNIYSDVYFCYTYCKQKAMFTFTVYLFISFANLARVFLNVYIQPFVYIFVIRSLKVKQ